MRCAWRELAAQIDPWWLPLFVGLWLFIFWAFFFVEVPWRRAEYGRSWWTAPRHLTFEQRQRLDQWMRDSGWGWLMDMRKIWLAALLLVFVWPFVSPTFCENVVCRGNKGQLKPRTECVQAVGWVERSDDPTQSRLRPQSVLGLRCA
jgi:hypothetical protein